MQVQLYLVLYHHYGVLLTNKVLLGKMSMQLNVKTNKGKYFGTENGVNLVFKIKFNDIFMFFQKIEIDNIR